MLIVFRVDASPTIGAGHLSRCLTLADELQRRGACCVFVGACDIVPLRERIVASGHRHVDVRPASSDDDADRTAAAIAQLGDRADWLVVDHYGLDAAWSTRMRVHAGRVLAIDDLADRDLDADVLLDQNLVANADSRYAGRIPPQCVALLGPHWALLQPAYRALRQQRRIRSGVPRRLLVSFGGGDADITLRTVAALARTVDAATTVDVVVPHAWAGLPQLQATIAARTNFVVHIAPPSLAELLAAADLAIGACGSTAWERLCLGVPSLTVTLADNQVPLAQELAARGLTRWLGDAADVDEQRIADAVAACMRDGIDPQWSQACAAVVDGAGAVRVADLLLLDATARIAMRPATDADEALLLRWANDPETRRNAFSTAPIDAATHHAWLARRLAERDACRLYIAQTAGGYPIGQVRFQRGDTGWEVHYGLAPEARRRGLGAPMLGAALAAFRIEFADATVTGRVRTDNPASCRVFERLGFDERVVDASTTSYVSCPAAVPAQEGV